MTFLSLKNEFDVEGEEESEGHTFSDFLAVGVVSIVANDGPALGDDDNSSFAFAGRAGISPHSGK